MNKLYNIKDKFDRNWGLFKVFGISQDKMYGYLEPTKEFESIRSIFTSHDIEITKDDGDTDTTIQNILSLGAYLVDADSNEVIDIGGVIFINHENLVTCEEIK